jgi:CheY-like chemotaxis protein
MGQIISPQTEFKRNCDILLSKKVIQTGISLQGTTRMTNHTTILLVEDDPLVLMLMLQVVERAVAPSAQIMTARNGEEGLLRAREVQPDLIVTDLMMPKMDGYDMVQSLRQEQIGSQMWVIGLSSASAIDPRTKDFRKLCDKFLSKPFQPHDLVAALNRPD